MTDTAVTEARLDEWPVRALEAVLDRGSARSVTDELPPLWHWLYFLQAAPRSRLGIDGHPAPGGGDPAMPMRRMFASARVQFHRPLRLGTVAQMSESVLHSRDTIGSGGPLHIVTHGYAYRQEGRDCISEERDIVYLPQAPKPAEPAAAATRAGPDGPADAASPDWQDTVTPDAVMLFRFSALTFNAHRIHYDQQYAQKVEGHRERLVHGPLTAILLAESLREHRPGPLRRFEFRARRPLFVDNPILITGRADILNARLRAVDPTGATAMEAVAAWGAAATGAQVGLATNTR